VANFQRTLSMVALLVLCSFLAPAAQAQGALPSGQMQAAQQDADEQSEDRQSVGQGSALRISPAVVDNALDPGTEFELNLRLTNLTEGPLAVRSASRELGGDQDLTQAQRQAFNASDWFEIAESEFILVGGETRDIEVQVSVPEDAEPGGHYATLDFEAFRAEASTPGATTINARVNASIYLTILGDIREDIEFVGPVQTETFRTDAFPTEFEFELRNAGNVHTQPRGELVVRDIFGRVTQRIDIDQAGVLLPGSTRLYDELDWEQGLTAGMFNVTATLEVGPSATIIESEPTQFYLVPLVLIVPLVALALLALAVVLVVRKRRRTRLKPPTIGKHMADPES
jgi:hypothetical protein